MKAKIIQFSKHPLISLSAVIFIGSLVASFFNFLFNLFMSRNLSVSGYGDLTSLISLITLAIMPSGALLPTIIHFSAKYFAKNESNMAHALFFKVGKVSLSVGLLLLLGFISFSGQIAEFFNIKDSSLVIVVGFIVFISYLSVMNSGLLQAKLSFGFLSFSQLIGAFSKLVLGTIFVLLGFSTTGAIWAFFLSYFIPYFITFIPLRFLFQKQTTISVIPLKDIFSYGMPSALTLFSLTSFITVDTLIVKHFFDPKSAGIYAGISLLGRVIFFFSSPIGTVMFPLVVQKHTKQESIRSTFLLATLLVFFPSVFLTLVYFFFPELIIGLSLKNDAYLSGSFLLGIMGIYMSIYSLLYIFANFCLSINKTRIYLPIVVGSILQAVLLWIFHKSFFQVVMISTGIVSVLLMILLLYIKFYGIKRN